MYFRLDVKTISLEMKRCCDLKTLSDHDSSDYDKVPSGEDKNPIQPTPKKNRLQPRLCSTPHHLTAPPANEINSADVDND